MSQKVHAKQMFQLEPTQSYNEEHSNTSKRCCLWKEGITVYDCTTYDLELFYCSGPQWYQEKTLFRQNGITSTTGKILDEIQCRMYNIQVF
jgi:hypothetical protein